MAKAKQAKNDHNNTEVHHPILAILAEASLASKPSERLAIMARRSAEACGVDRCSIFLVDKTGQAIWPVTSQFSTGKNDEGLWQIFWRDLRISASDVPEFSEVLHDRVIRTVQPESISAQLSERISPFHIHSLLLVPILISAKVRGILAFDTTTQRAEFSEPQLTLAEQISHHLGILIESSYLARRYEDRARRSKGLLELIEMLLQTRDLNETLTNTWEFVRSQLDVKTFFVALYDADGDRLSFPMIMDREKPISIEDRILGETSEDWGVTGWVVKNQEECYWASTKESAKVCEERGIAPVLDGEPAETAAYFPLVARGSLIGVVSFQSYDAFAFDEHDMLILRDTASQIAAAIASARQASDLDQANKMLGALNVASQMVGRSVSDIGQVYEDIGEAARGLIPQADHASLHLWREDEALLYLAMSTPHHTHEAREPFRFADGEGLVGWVFKNREPAIVHDAEKDARYKLVLHPEVPLHRSLICAPVILQDQVLGVLTLSNIARTNAFSKANLDLLMTFSEHVAPALENATEYQQLHNERQLLERMAGHLNDQRSIEGILGVVMELSQQFLKCEALTVHLLDDSTGAALRTIAFPLEEKNLSVPSRPIGGLTQEVIRSRKPVLVPDTSKDDRVNPKVKEAGIQSLVGFPLMVRGKMRGVLFLDSKRPQQFQSAKIELLTILANQVGLALYSIRLHEQRDVLANLAVEMSGRIENEEELLRTVIYGAVELLDAEGGGVYLLDSSRKWFEMKASMMILPKPELLRFPANEGMCGYILEIGKSFISNNYSQWERRHTALDTQELKAVAGVPIRVAGEIIGTIVVHDSRHNVKFGSADLRLLEQFALHASIAVGRARLLQELQQNLDLLEKRRQIVREVTNISAQFIDLPIMLQAIVEGIRVTTGCDVVTAYAYDDEKDEFVFPPAMDGVRDEAKVLNLGYVARESVPYRILELEDLHQTTNTVDDPVMSGLFTLREGVIASVGVPLIAKGRKLGVMCINYRQAHEFSTAELNDIRMFASHAAISIYSAKQHNEISERAQALLALHGAGRAVTASLDINEILSSISEQAFHLTETDESDEHFSHFTWIEGNRLRFRATFPTDLINEYQPAIADIDLNQDEPIGIVGRVAIDREPILSGNVASHPDYRALNPIVHSQISVPVKINDEVVGVISTENSRTNAFNMADLSALETLAAYAAIAIQNTRAFEELQKTQILLASRTYVAWIGMASSTLWHATEGKAIDIKLAVDNVVAELTALNNSGVAPKEILQGEVGKSLEKIKEMSDQIIQEKITTPLTHEEMVESIPIASFIKWRVQKLRKEPAYSSISHHVQCNIDNSVTIRADRKWLQKAFDYLADNAVRAAATNDNPQVEIQINRRGRLVEIAVEDNGGGIPDEERAALFKTPIKKAKGSKGQGIGLLLANTIVQSYGGMIRIGDTGSQGTTMIIELTAE